MQNTIPESIRKKIEQEAEAMYPFTVPNETLFTINELKQLARGGYTAAAEQILSHPGDYGLAGRWVKCSERLPEKPDTYFVRWNDDGRVIILGACFFNFWGDDNTFDVSDDDDEDRRNPRGAQPDEWLDPAAPPSPPQQELVDRVAQLEQALREIERKSKGYSHKWMKNIHEITTKALKTM